MSIRFAHKHQEIIQTAFGLFLEHGFAKTSMDSIAQQAKISKATLYNHFADKYELFHQAMIWHCKNLVTDPLFNDYLKKDDIETRLNAFAQTLVRALLRPESIALMRVVIFESGQFKELGDALWKDGKLPLLEDFAAFLQKEVAAKILKIDDVFLAARQFFGLIKESLVWPALMGLSIEHRPAKIEFIIKEAVNIFINYYKYK